MKTKIELAICSAAFIAQAVLLFTDYHPLLIASITATTLVIAGLGINVCTDEARREGGHEKAHTDQ